MPSQTISKTELARQTRQILNRVRKESPLIVESYGEQEAAILDIIDYRLLRAVASRKGEKTTKAFAKNKKRPQPQGLSESMVEQALENSQGDIQAMWDLIISTLLNGDISMGRASTLLNLSRFELIGRFHRLNIPLPAEPQSKQEALDDFVPLRK